MFRNKLDENGIMTRNKARIVVRGCSQAEGIDYEKTYYPVARLEAIRFLLAFARCHDFKWYQMDVKYAFINDYINEEVYVSQPLSFEYHENLYYGIKIKRTLYGLNQAPRTWYERLFGFLIKEGINRGKVDTTLIIIYK